MKSAGGIVVYLAARPSWLGRVDGRDGCVATFVGFREELTEPPPRRDTKKGGGRVGQNNDGAQTGVCQERPRSQIPGAPVTGRGKEGLARSWVVVCLLSGALSAGAPVKSPPVLVLACFLKHRGDAVPSWTWLEQVRGIVPYRGIRQLIFRCLGSANTRTSPS